MRHLIIAVLVAVVFTGCKDEEAKGPATNPSPQASRVPEPSKPANTRDPNTEKQDILGTWKSTGDEPLEIEFTPTQLTIRKGQDLKDAKTVPYTLRNEIRPSEIDWGTGADAGYGLYTLEGDQLWIDFNTGSPESRPKKPGKAATHTQWEFKRQS